MTQEFRKCSKKDCQPTKIIIILKQISDTDI